MIKDCRVPVREVEEEDCDEAIIWGAAAIDEVVEEISDLNSAESNEPKSTWTHVKTTQPSEACEAGKSGLEPKWRKKIQGGYRLSLVMDSGTVKTILPRDAIPGMCVKKKS